MLNVFEELSESSQRLILGELRSGPKNVSEITACTGLKQPNVSNHLARMRDRNVVRASRVGRQVYYALTPDVEAVVHTLFQASLRKPVEISFSDLAREYAHAAVEGRESHCVEILDDLYRANVPLLEIYEQVLGRAMWLIGDWYKVLAIDESQEHMASYITERMMARTTQMASPSKRNGKVAILGCAAHSHHVIGLRMICDYMRTKGWNALFLGADTPTTSFANSVRVHEPNLVLVSCSVAESAAATIQLIHALSALRGKKHAFVIGVGGQEVLASPQKYLDAGADFTATDLRSFAESILPAVEAGDLSSTQIA